MEIYRNDDWELVIRGVNNEEEKDGKLPIYFSTSSLFYNIYFSETAEKKLKEFLEKEGK